MKTKFNIITSTCVPLPLENVDTDQIIPARFLKATTKEGFGENLFRDWRYDKEGNKIESFVLNDPTSVSYTHLDVYKRQTIRRRCPWRSR